MGEWLIVSESEGRCINCGKLTNNVSITFEAFMCSEKCDDELYVEYEKATAKGRR